MAKTSRRKANADASDDSAISEEEAVLAARQAFTFLTACARGEVPGITTGERIAAANGVLTHTARVPRLMDALLEGVGMLGDEDVIAIASVLD